MPSSEYELQGCAPTNCVCVSVCCSYSLYLLAEEWISLDPFNGALDTNLYHCRDGESYNPILVPPVMFSTTADLPLAPNSEAKPPLLPAAAKRCRRLRRGLLGDPCAGRAGQDAGRALRAAPMASATARPPVIGTGCPR